MRFDFNLTKLISQLGKPFFLLLIFLLQITEFIGHIALFFIKKLWRWWRKAPVFKKIWKKILNSKKRFLKKFKINLPRPAKKRGAFFLFVFSAGFSFYFFILKDLPSPQDLADHRPFLTTKIYDRQGRLLYKIYREENRTLVSLNDLPPFVIGATLAAEDNNFWNHSGISWRGIVRAAWFDANNIGQDPVGGSTITQQLVKNVFFGSQKTIRRKLKEAVLAFLVEMKFSKKQILQMYLNQIPYGGTAYGIEEASQKYFSKPARDLTLPEAALLAGFPRAPTRYSPFGRSPNQAKNRQRQVLGQMLKNGYINREEYQNAIAQDLHFKLGEEKILAPHFVFYVKNKLIQMYGRRLVEQGGLNVFTSLDLDIQRRAEKILAEELEKVKKLRVSNGAVLVTNPKTGEILAMVGSKNYFDFNADGNVNVTVSLRQPGSAIKPVNYAVALQKGFTPATVINDAPVSFNLPGQKPYSPKNYDNRFHGKVNLRTALASSLNVPAVKVLAVNGVANMVEMGRAMGIKSWDDSSRFGLSLTLGGGEVRMTEMATAYGVLANLGRRVDLRPILRITGPRQEELYRAGRPASKPVLDSGIAFLLNDILSDDAARSLAFGRRSLLAVTKGRVAVKTGTTNNLRDNWAIGYTPDFLVAVWVGNNDNSPMSGVASGITGATPIWRRLTDYLLTFHPSPGWRSPADVARVKICPRSGTLSCSACPSPRWEYFIKGSLPKRACRPADFAPPPTPTPGK